jgi:hypothetical protein
MMLQFVAKYFNQQNKMSGDLLRTISELEKSRESQNDLLKKEQELHMKTKEKLHKSTLARN